jgi:hypothetical protein
MKASNKWILVLLVLTLPLLACGLISDLIPSEAQREALIQEAAQAVEEIAADAAEEAEQQADEAAELLEEAGAEAEAVAEAAPLEAETSPEEADTTTEEDESALDGSDGGASGALPFSDMYGSLQKLDSYLAEYRVTAESQDETVSIDFQMAETANPRAMHLMIETSESNAGNERIEIFVVEREGLTTMYMKNPDPDQEPPWITMSGTSMDEAMGMLPISPDSFGAVPSQGKATGTEMINGMQTTVYNISKDDYAGIPGLTEAEGKYWYSEEYQIVVKADTRLVGSESPLGPLGGGESGSYTMAYELKKLNDPSIVITVPEEALASDPMAADQAQFPLPPGAEVDMAMTGMVSAVTPDNVEAVKQFYEQQFGSDMEIGMEMAGTVMATIIFNGEPHQAMFMEEDNNTRIIITQEQ